MDGIDNEYYGLKRNVHGISQVRLKFNSLITSETKVLNSFQLNFNAKACVFEFLLKFDWKDCDTFYLLLSGLTGHY